MKAGSRLGRNPLSPLAAATTGASAVLNDILDRPSPTPQPHPAPSAETHRVVGETYAKAQERLCRLAARAGMIGHARQDRTVLLLLGLMAAYRVTPDAEGVDLATFLGGLSFPWDLRVAPPALLVPLETAFSLARGVDILIDVLRRRGAWSASDLTLAAQSDSAGVSLLLSGTPESLLAALADSCGAPPEELAALARHGGPSVTAVLAPWAAELRLRAANTL